MSSTDSNDTSPELHVPGVGYVESSEGEGPHVEETEDADIPVDSEFTGPYFQEIGKRKKQGRDAKTIVTGEHAQTGIGKSNICDFLGYVTDTTESGFDISKVAIDPPEFFSFYDEPPVGLPAGSAAILEEGEQLDARRFMSNENVDASHKWAKNRVREIIAFINLPSPEMIDGRLELLSDYWINVEVRGRARIYKKKVHRTKRKVYFETMQVLKWPNMDGSKTFRAMQKLKEDHINDKSRESNWMRRSEHYDKIDQVEKQTERETRDRIIRSLLNNENKLELGPADIEHGFAITQERIGQIARK